MNQVYVCLFVLFQSVSSLSAQKVTTVNNYPVIDLTELAPLGAVLTSTEAKNRRTEIHAQTASKDAYVIPRGSAASGENGTWNAKMSSQFQVMSADLENKTFTWVDAYSACNNYSGEGGAGGNWRLPTQRELQMIWVLHPQLLNKGGFAAFSADYFWSSTEGNASDAWTVRFYNGYSTNYGKTYTCRVRCVRDL